MFYKFQLDGVICYVRNSLGGLKHIQKLAYDNQKDIEYTCVDLIEHEIQERGAEE